MLRRSPVSFGRRPMRRSGRPSDNSPWFDRGPVEWIPRPVRLPYSTIDQARNWMMRETLDGKTDEFNKMRDMQREWGQHPLRPVLGDIEPKFPKGVYKENHKAKRRFLYRWQKANSPNNWMWLPKTGFAPERRQHSADYPENWRQKRDAAKVAAMAVAAGH